jgi:hypothetical protein
MSSSINPNNIDTAYPVAGQDNDSQGFRDNFTNIKTSFTYAKAEIEDLQSKAILKSALSGSSLDNDMAGAEVTAMRVTDLRETKTAKGTVDGTVTVDIEEGGYQTVNIDGLTTGAISLAFSNWPAAGSFSKVRVSIIAVANETVTLPAAVSIGTEGITGYASNVITFPEGGTYDFEFSTDDGGSTITIVDLNRSKENVRYNLEDLADAAAASLDVTTSYFATSAAETATLADGVEGQVKVFAMTAAAGDMVITVASAGWVALDAAGTITFSSKGDGCTLQFVNGAWYCTGNYGAVFA